jgi:hypothetical protein
MSTARIDVDHPRVARMAIIGTAALAAAAFAAAAGPLVEVGRWAGLGALAWATPLVLDAGIAVALLARLVAVQRGTPSRLLAVGTGGLTALSVSTQVVHSLAASSAPTDAGRVVGTILAGVLPLVVLLSVEATASLIVGAPVVRPRSVRGPVQPQVVQPSDRATVSDQDRPAPVRPEAVRPSRSVGSSGSARTVDMATARALAASGLSQRAIAAQLGASRSSVARALKAAA